MRKDQHYWRNLGVFGLGVAVVSLVLGLGLKVYQGAQQVVHPVERAAVDASKLEEWEIAYVDIVLTTVDGVDLAAWYTAPQNGAVILVAHGYSEQRYPEIYRMFAAAGYGVLAWDFRAHGESGGDLCTLGYYEVRDVEAALEYALEQPRVEHIGAWGGSMGGATVLMAAAARSEIEAVVADSAYAALEDELEMLVPLGMARPVLRYFAEREAGVRIGAIRPEAEIGKISPNSVLIIQGLADPIVNPDSGRRLYAAAGEPKELWEGEGGGHLWMHRDAPAEYEERVIGFFDRVLLGEE